MVGKYWGNLILGSWNGREVIALKSAKRNDVVKWFFENLFFLVIFFGKFWEMGNGEVIFRVRILGKWVKIGGDLCGTGVVRWNVLVRL